MTEQLEPEAKALRVEVKADGDDGAFSAVFATFDVVDAHGDVTRPGAYKAGAEVLIGAYNHDTSRLPVGKGVIKADKAAARVEGNFWTHTTAGRETYEAVKAAGSLMEWSYILLPTKWSYGEHEGIEVRFLEEIDVWSVDPVLKGAGVDTRTLSIKSGMAFVDHLGAALIAVSGAVARAAELTAARVGKGKALTDEAREAIEGLLTGLDTAKGDLAALVAEPKSNPEIDHAVEALRFEAAKSRALGVGN